MKVWMAIGYTDFEGDDNCDGVFTNKDEAVDHILNIVAYAWSEGTYDRELRKYVYEKVCGRYDKKEFISRTKDYISKHPEITYWYFWSGSDFWKEIFEDWNDDKGCWVALHQVELR